MSDDQEYKGGEIAVDDNVEPSGDFNEGSISAPGDNTDPESVSANKISDQELSEVSQDNIIEGERSTRGKDFNKGDDELDAQVDQVVQSDEGQNVSS